MICAANEEPSPVVRLMKKPPNQPSAPFKTCPLSIFISPRGLLEQSEWGAAIHAAECETGEDAEHHRGAVSERRPALSKPVFAAKPAVKGWAVTERTSLCQRNGQGDYQGNNERAQRNDTDHCPWLAVTGNVHHQGNNGGDSRNPEHANAQRAAEQFHGFAIAAAPLPILPGAALAFQLNVSHAVFTDALDDRLRRGNFAMRRLHRNSGKCESDWAMPTGLTFRVTTNAPSMNVAEHFEVWCP